MPLIPTDFKDLRVLVIGHSGFKGSWLTAALTEAGAHVWGMSISPPSDGRHAFFELGISQSIGNPETQFADVRDFECLRRLHAKVKPDLVFHVAAQALVSHGYEDPLFTFSTNAIGVVNSLELQRISDIVRPLIVVTSDKAYRNTESTTPYREDAELFGDDPYSASKAMAEVAVHAYGFSYPHVRKAGLVTVRAGNVFGGGDWSANRLVPDCARQLEASGSISLRMPHAVRPWTYVLDVVFGYLKLASSLLRWPETFGGAWNFASGELLTVEEVAQAMAHSWRPEGEVRVDSSPIGHETTFLQIDATKAREELSWRPLRPVRESLDRTAGWYLQQSNGGNVREASIAEIREYWRDFDDDSHRGTHGLRGA